MWKQWSYILLLLRNLRTWSPLKRDNQQQTDKEKKYIDGAVIIFLYVMYSAKRMCKKHKKLLDAIIF